MDMDDMDDIVKMMLELNVPITQRGYLLFAFFGDVTSVDELDAEAQSMLPEGFEDWPRTETDIN